VSRQSLHFKGSVTCIIIFSGLGDLESSCTTPKFSVSSMGGCEKGNVEPKKKQRDRNRLVNISVQSFFSLHIVPFDIFSLSPGDWFIWAFRCFLGLLDWMFVMPLW
jgi:hypothetical protein